ncbi:MAG: DUF4157 domain-containing protein [Ardenticatenaceae bacterium]|nr:DUF4157 domain-containing protein [Ardenticatenaceae bacterium]
MVPSIKRPHKPRIVTPCQPRRDCLFSQKKAAFQPTITPVFAHHFNQIAISPQIQTKLSISQPGDKFEEEADRVADQIMRMPDPKVQRQVEEEEEELIQPKSLTPSTGIYRQIEEEEEEEHIQPKLFSHPTDVYRQVEEEGEEEEEEELLMPKGRPGAAITADSSLPTRLQQNKGRGFPLPAAEKTFMESRFGADFSQVRIHTDHSAAQMNRTLNAQAFTYGKDIYFSPGKYNPGTSAGKKLLAHELTHVVQQKSRPWIGRRRRRRRGRRQASFQMEMHVIGDRGLMVGGATFHTTLPAFRNAMLGQNRRQRRARRGRWTLWFAIHGWNGVVAYSRSCTLGVNCYNARTIRGVFGRAGWQRWLRTYGPSRVVLYSCNLNATMTTAIENSLKRPGTARTQAPRSRRCNITYAGVSIPVRGTNITTRRQYRRLRARDRRQFMRSLRSLRVRGYGQIPPAQIRTDQQLRQLFFDRPPRGQWMTAVVRFTGVGARRPWRIYLYQFTRFSTYAMDCQRPAALPTYRPGRVRILLPGGGTP